MKNALQLDPRDNIAVALTDLEAGDTATLQDESITLTEAVPAKHKFAMRDFAIGDIAMQYGVTVGKVTQTVLKGGRLTTDNLTHLADQFTSSASSSANQDWQAPDISDWQSRSFDGYHRSDGSVGTSNHWLVIPLVFCENRNIEVMREAFEKALGYTRAENYQSYTQKLVDLHLDGADRDTLLNTEIGENADNPPDLIFPNIDGIQFLTHGLGCGGTRHDAQTLCGLLAGYITHPNVAGATVLSLGCQHAQVEILQDEIKLRTANLDKPLLVFEQQQWPSEQAMLTAAMRETFVGLVEANQITRQPAPLSKLTLGVECGGSDGFSGISANPLIGQVSDLLVALGGSSILAEFPELCGVEQNLLDRCTSEKAAQRFAQLMSAYAARAEASGSGFDQNPSPGNIRDGLTTDAIKSAGAAKKGGTSPVVDVLDYPEHVTQPGLNLLCTPGGDVESTTAMAGAHANMMVFSTGLGTPTGNPICPVIKISTNSSLAQRMADIIDFDAGPIIDGRNTIPALAQKLLDLIIEIASGRAQSKAQQLGQKDFLPWKRDVSL
ncbi:MAG: altronate dehydratase family protein [Verrucomicrobiales bacterium]|nr:altronate dehydratase family protein [Verrucomicrobiales bacterium]